MPVNVCEASMNREKRSRPSNRVVVDVKVGVASTAAGDGVNVGGGTAGVGGKAVFVGATCGAQAVSKTPAINNTVRNFFMNIVILLVMVHALLHSASGF
jgi:hypothetical protein